MHPNMYTPRYTQTCTHGHLHTNRHWHTYKHKNTETDTDLQCGPKCGVVFRKVLEACARDVGVVLVE